MLGVLMEIMIAVQVASLVEIFLPVLHSGRCGFDRSRMMAGPRTSRVQTTLSLSHRRGCLRKTQKDARRNTTSW